MKNLIFKCKPHEAPEFVTTDKKVFQVVQEKEFDKYTPIGYTGRIKTAYGIYDIIKAELIAVEDDKGEKLEYYSCDLSGLTVGELRAVAATKNRELIMEVFRANEFTIKEINEALSAGSFNTLLK